MERRRAGTKRPHHSEEHQYWMQATASLSALNHLQTDPAATEAIQRVNKWLAAIPSEEIIASDGSESMKNLYTKLTTGLKEVKATADEEIKLINESLEHLSILIALRRAPDGVPQEKRVKRLRQSSPASNPASPFGIATPPVSNSHGPTARSSSGRSRRDILLRQLPLQPGRKVAFRQPAAKSAISAGKGADASGADAESETWILAEVTKCINADRNKYEVQDADDTEEGEPRQLYVTTTKSLMPLPDPSTSPTNPAHPNAYGDFPAGSVVMGLYPETSCFYRAVVVAGPKDPPPPGFRTVPGSRNTPSYHLKFDDDDGQTRVVGVQWVVDWPHSP